jgi:hypothetical protein
VIDHRHTTAVVPPEFEAPVESARERRERLADRYDYEFAQDRIFPELMTALLAEIPDGAEMLEVGAATGKTTAPLLAKAKKLTAMEPSAAMLRRLLPRDVAANKRFHTIRGMVEDLKPNVMFDVGVVAFTPRRGVGLLHLLVALALHVRHRVVMLLDDDGSLDCAYLARAASSQGFDVRVHLVKEDSPSGVTPRRAAVFVADVEKSSRDFEPDEIWEFETRTLDLPYPAPRGATTRLIRYFLNGGERALVVRTDDRGMDRLYGNLRTAVHRLGREEVTVRRTEEGIQIVRLPKATD